MFYLVLGKILNLLGRTYNAIGQIVIDAKYLKNPDIRSRWTGM